MLNERRMLAGIPVRLAGPRQARGLVVFFHGAGGSKERSLSLASPLHALGFATLHPDAPHHGERGPVRDPFEAPALLVEAIAGSIEEAPALVAAARRATGAKRIFLLGASMGGYVVHELLARGLEARAAAVLFSAARPIPRLRPFLPEGFVPALDRAEAYPLVPLLHLHGEEDRVVPLAMMEETVARLAPRYARRPGALAKAVFPGVGHEPRPELLWLAAGWFARWA